jgi:hypothetical protein
MICPRRSKKENCPFCCVNILNWLSTLHGIVSVKVVNPSQNNVMKRISGCIREKGIGWRRNLHNQARHDL